MFWDDLVPGSPASEKRQVVGMARNLKKTRIEVETTNDSESESPKVHFEDSYIGSPLRDSPIGLNFEEIWNFDVNVNVSNTDANINLSDQQITNIPEKTIVKPSGVSNTESCREEVEISNICMDLSNKDTNFIMDEGISPVEPSNTLLPQS